MRPSSLIPPLIASATALALLVGCTPSQKSAEPASPPPPSAAPSAVPPPLVPAMPLPENAVDNAVAKLDGIAEELMKSSGIPGMSVAVVHGGKTVYAKGFGVKDVRNGDDPANKVDADTVFQLASLSKPLGATVIAHQVGVGAISWDTPIAEKLPWFTLADSAVTKMVTIGDMYSHRSGLPDHAGDLLEDLGYDRRYVLEHLRQLPLDPFRISYAYTNFGVTAGAEAAAVAAGKSWEDLSQDVLYGPLGMTSTTSRFSAYEARTDKAVGHIRTDGSYQPLFVRDAQAESPAGGVSSSANDMTKWLTMMLADGGYNGQQIVDPKALLPAVTPQIVSAPASEPAARSGFYGYGFNVGTTAAARVQLSHSGAFQLGAGTNFLILPSADVAIVALTNGTPAGIPETLTAEFADLVQFGEVREDWRGLYNNAFKDMADPLGVLAGKARPEKPAPAPPTPTLVGTYGNSYWGPATIADANGKLTVALGPRDKLDLTHWDGNVFTFIPTGENAPPGTISKATFDGDRLILEFYDEDKLGTFTKGAR
ncbi:serine hydrolase [Mycolicibacterium sp. YH-1]|uniref:serine hydrolase domain-containing protein n=1 Tax=Mycolicibacterium sp. YH-1 TaxID=2908837 RepID=UPI001F4C04D3|nr:serine hydrolase domain-containing protein [Mycolicibacterium sp. YH-1]UNB53776.1 beta-lactamase family protein [Mycolicibacterium sp. YH-1]